MAPEVALAEEPICFRDSAVVLDLLRSPESRTSGVQEAFDRAFREEAMLGDEINGFVGALRSRLSRELVSVKMGHEDPETVQPTAGL